MPEHVPGRRTSGIGVLGRVLGVLHVIVMVYVPVYYYCFIFIFVLCERAKRAN